MFHTANGLTQQLRTWTAISLQIGTATFGALGLYGWGQLVGHWDAWR